MPKSKRAEWFKFHRSYAAAFQDATPVELGQAVKAALEYFETGDTSAGDFLTREGYAAYKIMTQSINEAVAEYARRVEAGKTGGAPIGNQNAKTTKTTKTTTG